MVSAHFFSYADEIVAVVSSILRMRKAHGPTAGKQLSMTSDVTVNYQAIQLPMTTILAIFSSPINPQH